MENCFRFLINVDQCLNMSYFDIFFYKLKSQHKFHLNNVQLFGSCADTSLHSAVTDIRLYLDKYPYHVGDFQIIVAMRSVFCPSPTVWKDSMLYRLLELDYELRRSRIFINSREQVRKALNLVMLYDADFSAELPELTSYMDSIRLEYDCALLLSQVLPADCPQTPEALARYCDSNPGEPAHDLLSSFAAAQKAQALQLERIGYTPDGNILSQERYEEPLYRKLARFTKDQLFNFQIFEAQIDRNNRRQNILALLRVTDFINSSTDSTDPVSGGQISLAHRCAQNWEQVWNDPDLEHRYASMLQNYRFQLNTAALELEQPKFCTPGASSIPTEAIPHDQAIRCTEGIFSDPELQKDQTDMRDILKVFVENRFSLQTLHHDWAKTYQKCRQLLDQMDYALKDYAENMSRQYSAILENRKRESVLWRSDIFTAGPNTEKDIARLAYERDQRLEKLKSPHMTPALSFQDRLNMENSLEQGNLTIRYYIRCLSSITVGGFLMLILACALVCFGHYTFLQPYVFQSLESTTCYLIYLGAIIVLMLLCWTMPYYFFRRKLRACIQTLQDDAEKYIKGYYTKAEHFHSYINLLNQLDYIMRRHRLLTRAYDTTHRLSQGYLWHKVQIRNHLDKLRFFQGLMELGDPPSRELSEQLLPTIDGDRVSDVIDSQVYWPQH